MMSPCELASVALVALVGICGKTLCPSLIPDNNNNTPPGAGHRVVVEGLSSQSVRPLRGLTGEARSRPGVTVAGGPTVQSDTGQQLHPSGARHLHHGCRISETAYTDAVQYLGVGLAWERRLRSPCNTSGPAGVGAVAVAAPSQQGEGAPRRAIVLALGWRHRLRTFLRPGAREADGLTGWGGVAVVGLRRWCRWAVLAAFLLRAVNFLMGVVQLLDVVEVVQIVPQERIQLRIVRQISDVPVPQVVEEILLVIKVIPQVRVSERIVEQIFDVPVLQVLRKSVSQVVEEILEVFKVIPQELVSEFIVEQVAMCPFRKSWRYSLRLSIYFLARIQHRTIEEIMDVPVPCSGAIVYVLKVFRRNGCQHESWSRLLMCPFFCRG